MITCTFHFLVDYFNNGRGQVADDERDENGQYHFGKTPIASGTSGSSRCGVSLDPGSRSDQANRIREGRTTKNKSPVSYSYYIVYCIRAIDSLVHSPEDDGVTDDDGQTRGQKPD